jgi:hypothetical protein
VSNALFHVKRQSIESREHTALRLSSAYQIWKCLLARVTTFNGYGYNIPTLTGDVALPEPPLTKHHTHKVRKGPEIAGAP